MYDFISCRMRNKEKDLVIFLFFSLFLSVCIFLLLSIVQIIHRTKLTQLPSRFFSSLYTHTYIYIERENVDVFFLYLKNKY